MSERHDISSSSVSLLIEQQGIDIVPDAQRIARPSQLFWPWFSSNISVFSMSYGAFVLGFGISFMQALIASVIGIIISFALCGLVAIAGKRGSAPTMILSRATFGVYGQRISGVISWLTSLGWETFLSIAAVLSTVTVFKAIGWGHGTPLLLIASLVVAGVIVIMAVLGYHAIMRLQAILTWVTGIATVLFLILIIPRIDFSRLSSLHAGSTQSMVGALVMTMTGFGLGWINIAADWTRYQSRSSADSAIVGWNIFGGSIAPIVLVLFGVLLTASNPGLSDRIGSDPVGALVTLLPTWALVPFWIIALLTLISGAVLGIYSSGLTLLSLGVKLKRPMAAGIDGVLLTLGTLWVVFYSPGFLAPFQSFLITLGVPVAAWAGLVIADVLCRRKAYDEAALFDPNGCYGAYDIRALLLLLLASIVGWGLVVNGFSAEAPWNDWQGYLLSPLGGKSGPWAYANLGVIVALLIGWAGGWCMRRGRIRQQENSVVYRQG